MFISSIKVNPDKDVSIFELNRIALAQAEDSDCIEGCKYDPGSHCRMLGYSVYNYKPC